MTVVFFLTNGPLHRHWRDAQAVFHRIQIHLEIGAESEFRGVIDLVAMKAVIWPLDDDTEGAQFETVDIPAEYADAVHLVDVGEARDGVLVGLTPDGLRLRLDAGDGVEDGDGAVEDAEAALDLDREVDVAGRVDDVDAVVVPLARRRRGRDRDAALLLLLHPVHDRGALVNLADFVRAARVVEDALGRRRLTGVDVRHDPDVSGLEERELAGHGELWCWVGRFGQEKRATRARAHSRE